MAASRNLLIVLAHGFRSDAVGDDPRWPMRTPHLEVLCRRGLRLVASSACPTDWGGMASLVTGLHARQHGHVTETADIRLTGGLCAWLADAGYHLAGVGNVGMFAGQLHECVMVGDVAELEPKDCQYLASARNDNLRNAIIQQRRQRMRGGPFEPDRLMLDPDDDIDGFIANRAVKMLETMPEDRPWVLFVVFSGPGNDLPPPPLYETVLNPEELTDDFCPVDFTELNALAEPVYPRIMLQRLEPHILGRIRADYFGRVCLVDHSIGQFGVALDRRADAVRTWTAFCSDRGHLLGECGLIGHRSFLAGAVEVPMIIAPPPGTPEPDEYYQYEGLISTVDFSATVGALGSCDHPHEVTGRSLLPIFRGDPVMPVLHGGNLSEFNDRLLLETERYKIIFARIDGRCLGVYDLLNDPNEKRNLIDNPISHNLIDSLRWRLADALLPLRAAVV